VALHRGRTIMPEREALADWVGEMRDSGHAVAGRKDRGPVATDARPAR
jgi:hypothetical protein